MLLAARLWYSDAGLAGNDFLTLVAWVYVPRPPEEPAIGSGHQAANAAWSQPLNT